MVQAPWSEVCAVVLAAAEAEWERPVVEPPGPNADRIDTYIRGSQGLGWGWESRYTRDRQFAWCGAFMAWCWGAAGLRPELRRRICPSTYRIWKAGQSGPDRLPGRRFGPPVTFLPGDVAIVGPEGGKPWGSHITLVREWDRDRGELLTVEGNARGVQPDGEVREGVVHQRRPLPRPGLDPGTYRVLWRLRWEAADLEGVEIVG